MKKISISIVVAIFAAACSSTSGSEMETTSSAPAEVTTTVAAATTSSASTTGAADGGQACLVGTWDLDSEAFFAATTDAMSGEEIPGDFRYLDGTYRIALGDDGSVIEQREDWTFVVTTDSGDLVMTVNSRAEGTYANDGEELSLDVEQSSADVEILVDGVPLDLSEGVAPAGIPDVSFTSSPYTCTADTLVVTAAGVPSTWQRTG